MVARRQNSNFSLKIFRNCSNISTKKLKMLRRGGIVKLNHRVKKRLKISL